MQKFGWTGAYIASVAFINWLLVALPPIVVGDTVIPPVMLLVGFVFVFRDMAQRETGHYVVFAMLIGGALSYFIATPAVALASVTAFLASETIDWIIFTLTKKPLSQRILLSSAVAVPADTIIFLSLIGLFDWFAVIVISLMKMVAAVCFWLVLRKRDGGAAAMGPA